MKNDLNFFLMGNRLPQGKKKKGHGEFIVQKLEIMNFLSQKTNGEI